MKKFGVRAVFVLWIAILSVPFSFAVITPQAAHQLAGWVRSQCPKEPDLGILMYWQRSLITAIIDSYDVHYLSSVRTDLLHALLELYKLPFFAQSKNAFEVMSNTKRTRIEKDLYQSHLLWVLQFQDDRFKFKPSIDMVGHLLPQLPRYLDAKEVARYLFRTHPDRLDVKEAAAFYLTNDEDEAFVLSQIVKENAASLASQEDVRTYLLKRSAHLRLAQLAFLKNDCRTCQSALNEFMAMNALLITPVENVLLLALSTWAKDGESRAEQPSNQNQISKPPTPAQPLKSGPKGLRRPGKRKRIRRDFRLAKEAPRITNGLLSKDQFPALSSVSQRSVIQPTLPEPFSEKVAPTGLDLSDRSFPALPVSAKPQQLPIGEEIKDKEKKTDEVLSSLDLASQGAGTQLSNDDFPFLIPSQQGADRVQTSVKVLSPSLSQKIGSLIVESKNSGEKSEDFYSPSSSDFPPSHLKGEEEQKRLKRPYSPVRERYLPYCEKGLSTPEADSILMMSLVEARRFSPNFFDQNYLKVFSDRISKAGNQEDVLIAKGALIVELLLSLSRKFEFMKNAPEIDRLWHIASQVPDPYRQLFFIVSLGAYGKYKMDLTSFKQALELLEKLKDDTHLEDFVIDFRVDRFLRSNAGFFFLFNEKESDHALIQFKAYLDVSLDEEKDRFIGHLGKFFPREVVKELKKDSRNGLPFKKILWTKNLSYLDASSEMTRTLNFEFGISQSIDRKNREREMLLLLALRFPPRTLLLSKSDTELALQNFRKLRDLGSRSPAASLDSLIALAVGTHGMGVLTDHQPDETTAAMNWIDQAILLAKTHTEKNWVRRFRGKIYIQGARRAQVDRNPRKALKIYQSIELGDLNPDDRGFVQKRLAEYGGGRHKKLR